MKAVDIMTHNVITIDEDATVSAAARVLVANCISAVPVVNRAGRLVGIVSEGDLILRTDLNTRRARSWWLDALSGNRALTEEFARSSSRRIRDVMTTKVVCAEPDTPIGEIAALLEGNAIKRVPIIANGTLVGIVSRASLIRAIATQHRQVANDTSTLWHGVDPGTASCGS
jgi:CBS domain-containing protein